MNVEAIHALADLEQIRAKSFNAVSSARADIATIITALSRTPAKVEISIELLGQLEHDLSVIHAFLESKR